MSDQDTYQKRVIFFAPKLLPWSETFIKEQALALHEWKPVLVGENRFDGGLALDGLENFVLADKRDGRLNRYQFVLCKRFGLPHPNSVRMLRNLNASLVHVHFGTAAVEIWPTIRSLGLPMFVTLHGFDITIRRDWWESGRGGNKYRRYPSKLLKLAAQPNVHFIAVSNAIRQHAIDYGIPPSKISVHYIGVDINRFLAGRTPLSDRANRVLFIGRMVEKKGVRHLIQAFEKVKARVPDAELVLAGDGPLYDQLKLLAEPQIGYVTFLGKVTPETVYEQLQQCKVLCLPSITAENGDAEGLPTVLMEAQSAGVPVVTSAEGGCGESIIDGLTGYSAPAGDIGSLADGLVRLLSNDQLLRDMSINASAHAKRIFDIRTCTAALEQRYERRALAQ